MNADFTETIPAGPSTASKPREITWTAALAWVASGSIAFHVAFSVPELSCLIVVYACSLLALSEAATIRLSFRYGFLVGLLTFSPHLYWFWNIFGPVAICLWAVLSFFPGVFVSAVHGWNARWGPKTLFLIVPILWTGLEYFRGELYFLRFSWMSVGFSFSDKIGMMPLRTLGIYGAGFFIFALAAIAFQMFKRRQAVALAVICAMVAGLANGPADHPRSVNGTSVEVAGIQLEFPPDLKIPEYLDAVIRKHPRARILVLSEYTLDGSVSERIRNWCRVNQRHLIIGGKDDTLGTNFYNTVFVVGPTGEIVFQQAKSVPIQFFKDGLPALSQEVWPSPWGKIAMCVCYDLSYRRVMDRFIEKGAQAFIVPFMDLTDWGAKQHQLHARVAPIRAREYGIPIFRLGSSGISQNVSSRGQVLGTAPFPGQEEIFGGELRLSAKPNKPLDTWLAPVCAGLTAAHLCVSILLAAFSRSSRQPGSR